MNIVISFKNMEHTPSLDQRIREKTQKIEKYWEGKTDVKWTCWCTAGEHFAEVNIVGPRVDYHAKAKSEDMYKTLDLVIDKIERQVQKDQARIKNKLHRGKTAIVTLPPSQAWGEFEAWEEEQDNLAGTKKAL